MYIKLKRAKLSELFQITGWIKTKEIKAKSKQNIQDANVLKLRIVYGYEPRIPLMKMYLVLSHPFYQ